MQLIIDSGSTKTLWCLVKNGVCLQEIQTLGINPYVSSLEYIMSIIQSDIIPNLLHIPDAIFYYGAGCSTPNNKKIIQDLLVTINPYANIDVQHDLLAVARSLCQHQTGIAVILGTGSNSCLYNGEQIIAHTPSLGYVIGDEGSGAHIGKQVLSDIWYNITPEELKTDFFAEFPHQLDYYLTKIYKEPAANAFLASFTTWLGKHKSHSYVQQLLKNCFSNFMEKHIVPYNKNISNKIHCTGSIAFYFRDEWKDVILKYGYELGNVEQIPINGLIQYHS
jgi:glucosamine kinase